MLFYFSLLLYLYSCYKTKQKKKKEHKFYVEQSEKEREEGEAGNDVNKKSENIKEEWNIAGKKEKDKQKKN